jgi:EAL domain-containing protein (putative c-di-GMP-specific phosphodiesterase class I)
VSSAARTALGSEGRAVVVSSRPGLTGEAMDHQLSWLTLEGPTRSSIEGVVAEIERADLELRVARLRSRIEQLGPGTVEYRTTSSRTKHSLELSLRSLAFDLRPITTMSVAAPGADGEHGRRARTRVSCEAVLRTHGPYGQIPRLFAAARAIGMHAEVDEAVVRALVGAFERETDPSSVALVDLQPSLLEVCADPRILRLAPRLVLLIDEQTLRRHELNRIRALRERGFGLALTGFGAGPLPLDGLVGLRPELVILHPSLIEMLGEWQDAIELVDELVELVTHAGGSAFARGVWNRAIASALGARGCGVFVTAPLNPLQSSPRWPASAS